MKKNLLFYLCFLFVLLAIPFFSISANPSKLVDKLKGKILLQVEQNGEAWYVNPKDDKRYFLGRPADAFNVMKSLGIGISNKDLEKIQIADENLSGGKDNDNDGLSNMVEDSIGTNKNKKDSDNDGYSDKEEILNGYNPNGPGKLNIDKNFAIHQSGKILLQVEQNGEAWYVNPKDDKRYFLGRPADAFNVMKSLGLGVTNNNLSKITKNQSNISNLKPSQEGQSRDKKAVECAEYPEKLSSCTKYTCTFTNIITGEKMKREIKGLVDGKCIYSEEMPNNSKLECKYTESMRKAVAQSYIDSMNSQSSDVRVRIGFAEDQPKISYIVDGKKVSYPLQEALDDGQCIMSETKVAPDPDAKNCPPDMVYKGTIYTYEGDNGEKKIAHPVCFDLNMTCPSDKEYEGTIYTYEGDNGEKKIAHPVCSDIDMTCPPCENCSFPYDYKLMKLVDGKGVEVCQECIDSSDCKTGYECNSGKCIIKK